MGCLFDDWLLSTFSVCLAFLCNLSHRFPFQFFNRQCPFSCCWRNLSTCPKLPHLNLCAVSKQSVFLCIAKTFQSNWCTSKSHLSCMQVISGSYANNVNTSCSHSSSCRNMSHRQLTLYLWIARYLCYLLVFSSMAAAWLIQNFNSDGLALNLDW